MELANLRSSIWEACNGKPIISRADGIVVSGEQASRNILPQWENYFSEMALAHGKALLARLSLGSLQDPEPAKASRRQDRQQRDRARWMEPLPACYALLLPAPIQA